MGATQSISVDNVIVSAEADDVITTVDIMMERVIENLYKKRFIKSCIKWATTTGLASQTSFDNAIMVLRCIMDVVQEFYSVEYCQEIQSELFACLVKEDDRI